MKKLKNIVAVILILAGLGGMIEKSYLGALAMIAVGAALFLLPRKKTTAPAARRGGVGTRSEITDDSLRVNCPEWIVLDTETTGLSSFEDRIIEVAAVRYKNGQPMDQFVSLVNPGMPLDPEITRLTGITDRELKKAPAFAEIAPKVRDFIGELPVVAHNAVFDVDFIITECARAGVKIDIKYINTVRMAKWCLPPQPDYKLATLIETFGLLDHAQEHRALSDVEACENLYMLCRSKKAGKV